MLLFWVRAPHGLAGDLRVALAGDGGPERLCGRLVRMGPALGEGEVYRVVRARPHRLGAVVHLAGVEDRSTAERLRGWVAWCDKEDVLPLPEGHWYVFELRGRRVEASDGLLGTLVDVEAGVAQDVLVIRRPEGELLRMPFARALVDAVTKEAVRLTVSRSFFQETSDDHAS